MKKCSKCGELKGLDEFSKDNYSKDGLCYHCKTCRNKYYKNNKEDITQYRRINKDVISKSKRKHYENNKEDILKRQKEYQKENKEAISKNKKEYNEINKEVKKEYQKEWLKNNKEHSLKYQKEYKKQKKLNDSLYKLSSDIRSLISMCIRNKGLKKNTKTATILGCTFEEFKLHIENQFSQGMTWDNRHLWHLDHIYPVSRAESEEHLIQLNHYTNFQPLWAEDNIRKGNKIPAELLDNQPNNLL